MRYIIIIILPEVEQTVIPGICLFVCVYLDDWINWLVEVNDHLFVYSRPIDEAPHQIVQPSRLTNYVGTRVGNLNHGFEKFIYLFPDLLSNFYFA